MATAITELNKVPNEKERCETYNISITDASTAIDLLSADPDYRYGIKSIDICGNFAGTEWFKFFDGESILIGPRILNSSVPWSKIFEEPIYCTAGNALKFQTESALNLNLVIDVLIGFPNPSSSMSASVSASPSD